MFFDTSDKSALFRGRRIRFGLTNRLGGVSKKPFDSLNLGFHTGDEIGAVRANRAIMIQEFRKHFKLESNPALYYLQQIHSCEVIVLTPKISEIVGLDSSADSMDFICGGKDSIAKSKQIAKSSALLDSSLESSEHSKMIRDSSDNFEVDLGEGDAIITNAPNALCMVMVADCNPILIYDSANEAFALIHAGRAGVFSAIVERAIEKMARNYGSKVEECLAYVGSSIRGCCYEVGAEIVERARDLGYDNAVIAIRGENARGIYGESKGEIKGKINDKRGENRHEREITYKLDLIACLKAQFMRVGIRESHIEICPQCSKCNENFYSYRRDRHTGRYGLLAMLV